MKILIKSESHYDLKETHLLSLTAEPFGPFPAASGQSLFTGNQSYDRMIWLGLK